MTADTKAQGDLVELARKHGAFLMRTGGVLGKVAQLSMSPETLEAFAAALQGRAQEAIPRAYISHRACMPPVLDYAATPGALSVTTLYELTAGAQEGEPSEWISVEDQRKPELGQIILLWVWAEDECETEEGRYYPQDVSQVQMGVYRDMGHGPFFDCFATPFADHEGVGYWMPMPAAPGAALAQAQKERQA